MKTKSLYIILIVVAGIAISVASISTALATVSITTIFASPANTFAGKGTQYAIKFNATNTGTNVGSIRITFPSGTTTGSAQIAELTGFPGAFFTSSGASNTFTININPPTKPTNPVFIFLAKVGNTATSGAASVTVTTFTGASGAGSIIDSGTTAFTITNNIGGVLFVNDTTSNVGIGKSSPTAKLDVNGNIRLSGNITSSAASGKTLTITPPVNGDICIGTGC